MIMILYKVKIVCYVYLVVKELVIEFDTQDWLCYDPRVVCKLELWEQLLKSAMFIFL